MCSWHRTLILLAVFTTGAHSALSLGAVCYTDGRFTGVCDPGLICQGGRLRRTCVTADSPPSTDSPPPELTTDSLRKGDECEANGKSLGTCPPPTVCSFWAGSRSKTCIMHLNLGDTCEQDGKYVGECPTGTSCRSSNIRFKTCQAADLCLRVTCPPNERCDTATGKCNVVELTQGVICERNGQSIGRCPTGTSCLEARGVKVCIAPTPAPSPCANVNCGDGKTCDPTTTPPGCVDIKLSLGDLCKRQGRIYGVCPANTVCKDSDEVRGKTCQVDDPCDGVKCSEGRKCDKGTCVDIILRLGDLCKRAGQSFGVCEEGSICLTSNKVRGKTCQWVDKCKDVECDKGLVCSLGECKVVVLELGETCYEGRVLGKCVKGSGCNKKKGVCVEALEVGAQCDVDDGICEDGAECNDEGVCAVSVIEKAVTGKGENAGHFELPEVSGKDDEINRDCALDGGETAEHGSTFYKACNTCSCTNGEVSCTSKICLIPFDTTFNTSLSTAMEFIMAIAVFLVLAYATGLIGRKKKRVAHTYSRLDAQPLPRTKIVI
eukprot:TRINITY_DN2041_c0_g1_i1.p1 TRINITY_DN2041_c0_g1~~TRINITY_DN2041_c0_g1_i1.p1  ORF type:complete len:566 (+),score=105.48 TRINITY_DN2041_c0_g1_i1:60-1700(+)